MIVRVRELFRAGALVGFTVLLPLVAGCQSPSEEETLDVDDFLETSAPASVDAGSGRDRTYRVVRGNNQPDEILEYDWHTAFSLSVRLNNNATADNVALEFPVTLSSATIKVQQASGGIVSPPSGGDVEHYESVTSQVSGNQFAGVSQDISMVFDIWYDLPSLRKEALVSATLTFADDNGKSFSKIVQVRVNP